MGEVTWDESEEVKWVDDGENGQDCKNDQVQPGKKNLNHTFCVSTVYARHSSELTVLKKMILTYIVDLLFFGC